MESSKRTKKELWLLNICAFYTPRLFKDTHIQYCNQSKYLSSTTQWHNSSNCPLMQPSLLCCWNAYIAHSLASFIIFFSFVSSLWGRNSSRRLRGGGNNDERCHEFWGWASVVSKFILTFSTKQTVNIIIEAMRGARLFSPLENEIPFVIWHCGFQIHWPALALRED